jgi:excisionase family DNA binding protein
MTLREVARYLSVHQLTIHRAIKAGAKLGQFRVGRVWRFSREELVLATPSARFDRFSLHQPKRPQTRPDRGALAFSHS